MQKDHIPLGVGFYPDWFYAQYGISFGREYYFNPETRVAARMEIDRRLYERFGDVGLGNPDPQPKPLITFGMVMLPSIFGCEIVYKDDALPWAMPLNLSEDAVMKLEVPDIFNTYPMTDMLRQIDYLKGRYGKVVGDINTTGVQNLALKIRGDQLYIDLFENQALCRHLLSICAACMIQLFEFNRKTTGTGAVDVTPMSDPLLCVLPNCTAEQISLETYENHVLEYDNRVADACHPVGIHHCGSVDQVLDGYAKVRHLEFIEIGFGSDVKHTREVFGPQVAVNARISPVLMKNGAPEEVAAEVRRLIDNGAPLDNFSIDTVGLTYGTPDENVRRALKTAAEYGKLVRKATSEGRIWSFRSRGTGLPPVETSVTSATKTIVIGPFRPLVIIGERINPTGRKRLAHSLEAGDLDLVRSEALSQAAQGADILDVNVGVSGIDEPAMLKKAVLAIQEVTDVPLCIDSALPEALAAGLSVCRGKPLVNSVNGEKHKLERVLPLVKEYGAAVIGLTMDDNGIPASAEKRLDIARRIVEIAERTGIPREDVIIDPLAMAISADDQAGLETLKALQLIRDDLGVNQTLGLSNISFGLPERTSINAVFLAMAAQSGLTCPIVDPTVWEMRRALLLTDMLLGRDPFCMRYLATAKRREGGEAVASEPGDAGRENADLERIKDSVISGKRKAAVEYTQKALDRGADPQEIINNYLIPGLNTVGERFEKKKIFVPEMMMAAKSMQACVDLLTPLLKKEKASRGLGTIVLGTVFGDLHDIGKNLTKLLLKTSGFEVIDLGENVPSARFVEAAREHKADVVGLSSLLTTGDPHVEETIRTIKESDLRDKVKVICGGAALTLKFVEACGADAHAKDAADGVKKIKALLNIEE
ncbi:MAG: 5-methyltetrahydrofolate--homocysteine methyltransferase [Thermodesulfobacteriota bacterium]|nr:5-methyltetrahydrofolate--homocysteine methyltransferase [Thermodesulfobacteriota bacterium]